MQKLKVLDLFSGIGGFSLGLERTGGFETVAFCEYDEKAQLVLKKHWPEVPIYNDVRTLEHDGSVDVICGGYPCQPFSTAGQRKGEEDDRHLWPSMFSLIKKHRPTWVIGENVAGHISMGLDKVLADLEGEDYGTRVFVIPACAVDAQHRRDRVWIVANSIGRGWGVSENSKVFGQRPSAPSEHASEFPEALANTSSKRQQGQGKSIKRCRKKKKREGKTNISFSECEPFKWSPEPEVGRVADGVPNRMDRLKQLGNAVVPQIPEAIGNAILESEFHNVR